LNKKRQIGPDTVIEGGPHPTIIISTLIRQDMQTKKKSTKLSKTKNTMGEMNLTDIHKTSNLTAVDYTYS
jgi:hypothetical protein